MKINEINNIENSEMLGLNENNVSPMVVESKSSIKLIKNTKGYNYEIKVVQGVTREELDLLRQEVIYQAEQLNKWETLQNED
jgi:hypothetical protein